jgi:hypothetical protein
VQKRITALLAVPALVALGLAAATSASASTAPASSVSAARHTVRSAAASAHATPASAPSPSLSPAPQRTGQGSATRQAADSPDTTVHLLCLFYSVTFTYPACVNFNGVGPQAYISSNGWASVDEDYVRTVSGDNTFTFGSGYNGLYAGDYVYCLKLGTEYYLTTTLQANGNIIVNAWTGSCTGVYDEWVAAGKWLVNVGETDWFYSIGFDEYPYSEVMESGCATNNCKIWVEESAATRNPDDQWASVSMTV